MSNPTTKNLDRLNEARAKTHGSFKANAEASRAIKDAILLHTTAPLTDIQKEVLDMVALKISRAITGDNMQPDHWLDMAGYPNLAYAEARMAENEAADKAAAEALREQGETRRVAQSLAPKVTAEQQTKDGV